MSRRRTLTGVQQAGAKIALTLEALANTGRRVTVNQNEGTIIDHDVVRVQSSWLIRYRVRVRRVGPIWHTADTVSFT
jgi:hypothetical protein